MIPGTLITLPVAPLSAIPAWGLSELLARKVGAQPHIVDITLGGQVSDGFDAHGSYMNPNRSASREMMERLRQLFPQMQLTAP